MSLKPESSVQPTGTGQVFPGTVYVANYIFLLLMQECIQLVFLLFPHLPLFCWVHDSHLSPAALSVVWNTAALQAGQKCHDGWPQVC